MLAPKECQLLVTDFALFQSWQTLYVDYSNKRTTNVAEKVVKRFLSLYNYLFSALKCRLYAIL